MSERSNTASPRLTRRRMLAGGGAAALAATTTLLAPSRGETAVHCTPFDWQGVQFCEAGIPSNIAGQSARPQYQSQWCWAACIAMIFSYYGHPVRQERIVSETFGSIVNMPAHPMHILSAVNRPWVDDNRRGFRSQGQALLIDAEVAAQHLIDEHPLIIGSLGHATVLTAMSWAQDTMGRQELTGLVVRDPWYGGQRRQLSGQEIYATDFLALVVAQGG